MLQLNVTAKNQSLLSLVMFSDRVRVILCTLVSVQAPKVRSGSHMTVKKWDLIQLNYILSGQWDFHYNFPRRKKQWWEIKSNVKLKVIDMKQHMSFQQMTKAANDMYDWQLWTLSHQHRYNRLDIHWTTRRPAKQTSQTTHTVSAHT